MEISSVKIRIREAKFEDLSEWHRLISDHENMYYLNDISTNTLEESRVNLAFAISEGRLKPRIHYFLVIESLSGSYLGNIGFSVKSTTPLGTAIEVGYFILPEFQNNGYVTEAMVLLMKLAFEQAGVYRLTIGCCKENIASEKIMIKCKLIKEAEFKHVLWHDGRLRDRVEYRILKPEWEAVYGGNQH